MSEEHETVADNFGSGLGRDGSRAAVTLAWKASPSPGVSNYRIYFGTNARSYSFVTNAGLVRTQTVVLPQAGRWFFAATAMDTNGLESGLQQ